MLTCEHYLIPQHLEEAFSLMHRFGKDGRIVAGTTDLLPWAREGRGGEVHFGALIDVSRVPELGGVRLVGERLLVGANTTFADCLRDPLLLQFAPVLAHCAAWFGDDSIRETATLGGNLINASPAADGTTALLTLNPRLTLQTRRPGAPPTRTLELAEFLKGPGKTALQEGELLTGIEVDALEGYGAAFEKVGHRRALVLSTVCLAVMVRATAGENRVQDIRIALGAVGPIPNRLTDCEQFLTGQVLDEGVIAQVVEMPLERVQSRTRRDYRREVLRGFMARALAQALTTGATGATGAIARNRRAETKNLPPNGV